MAKKSNTRLFRYTDFKKSNHLKSTIAERGQVTVPKELRDKMGLLPGTVVQWELKGKYIYFSKDRDDIRARIQAVTGCIKDTFPYSSTDEYMDEIRGPVE